MIVTGYIKDKSIVLDHPVTVPDGTRVEVKIPDITPRNKSGLCGIWQDSRSAEEIIDEIVSRTGSKEIKL